MNFVRVALFACGVCVLLLLVFAVVTDSPVFWRFLTMLGEEEAYVVLAILIYSLYDGRLAVALLAAIVFSGLSCIGVKHVLGLPRPPTHLWRVVVEGPGFPSGHTTVSTSFWCIVVLERPVPELILVAVGVVAAVAVSRLGLRVHYPRDIVGGLALGAAVALTMRILWRRLGARRLALLTALPAALLGVVEGLLFNSHAAYALAGVGLGLVSYPGDEKVAMLNRVSLWARSAAMTVVMLPSFAAVEAAERLLPENPWTGLATTLLFAAITVMVLRATVAIASRLAGRPSTHTALTSPRCG